MYAFQQVAEDQRKLAQFSATLESFAQLLDGREFVSGATAQSMSVALESIDPDFDIKEGSVITLRAIKEGIKAAAKAARDAIRYIFELLNSFYVKFTGSVKRVRNTQQGISQRLGRLGNRTTYKKMTVSGVQRLSIDGKFVGMELENLKDIRDTTDYILNKYPRSVMQVARNSCRGFLNIVEDSADKSKKEISELAVRKFIEVLKRDFVPPAGATAVSNREVNAGERGYHRSVILPGNVTFLYTPPEVIEAAVNKVGITDQVIGRSFSMAFSELPLNVADRSEREIEVPSVRVLGDLVNQLSSILTLAEKAEAGHKDFAQVKVVVDDTIRQIAEHSGNTGNTNNVLLHIAGEISRKLAEPMGFYTHWLAVTVNVYLSFISHCITHYENEGV